MNIDAIMRAAPVIPVLVLEEELDWVPLAETFVAAGLPVLEVTLRTPVAMEAVRQMAKVPGAIVGAGTVLNEAQLDASIAAGARFIVSPGLTEGLASAAIERGIALLPGISTASDIMRGLDLGLSHFKFFPAEASGGIAALKALAAPFHQCRFCPTGGITQKTAPDWLALDAVLCVGGSWLVQRGGVDPQAIEAAAAEAAKLTQRG